MSGSSANKSSVRSRTRRPLCKNYCGYGYPKMMRAVLSNVYDSAREVRVVHKIALTITPRPRRIYELVISTTGKVQSLSYASIAKRCVYGKFSGGSFQKPIGLRCVRMISAYLRKPARKISPESVFSCVLRGISCCERVVTTPYEIVGLWVYCERRPLHILHGRIKYKGRFLVGLSRKSAPRPKISGNCGSTSSAALRGLSIEPVEWCRSLAKMPVKSLGTHGNNYQLEYAEQCRLLLQCQCFRLAHTGTIEVPLSYREAAIAVSCSSFGVCAFSHRTAKAAALSFLIWPLRPFLIQSDLSVQTAVFD